MNSFRSVERAIAFEIERQTRRLSPGQALVQETRGWDDTRGETYTMRLKEESQDYRYFPEPDLPPLRTDPAWLAAIRARLPELPAAKRARYATDYGLSAYDASVIVALGSRILRRRDAGDSRKPDPKLAASMLFSKIATARAEASRRSVRPGAMAPSLAAVDRPARGRRDLEPERRRGLCRAPAQRPRCRRHRQRARPASIKRRRRAGRGGREGHRRESVRGRGLQRGQDRRGQVPRSARS